MTMESQENSVFSLTGAALEEAARHILGKYYEDIAAFFLSAYSCCYHQEMQNINGTFTPIKIAFVTRRSNVLMSIFSQIFCYYSCISKEKRPSFFQSFASACVSMHDVSTVLCHIETRYFITDSALLAQSGEIADYYISHRRLPYIVIFDELLLHGRALNNLLMRLELSLKERVERQLNPCTPEDIDHLSESFAHAIKVRIFVQSDESLLLSARYQQHIFTTRTRSLLKIRDFSKRFSALVAVAFQNNVAYSWTLRIPYCCKYTEVLQTRLPFLNGFFPRITSIQWNEIINYLLPYPNPSQPKAICSIRWRHSCLNTQKADNMLMIVPFIVFGKIPYNNLLRLHGRLIQDLKELNLQFLTAQDRYLEDNRGFYARWIAETNNLVLNALLCRRFLQACHIDDMQVSPADLRFMARNFASFSLEGSSVIQELERLWQWAGEQCAGLQLESYMDLLLEDVPPLWTCEASHMHEEPLELHGEEGQALLRAVEDAIISIADETELHAYRKSHSSFFLNDETLSNWGKYYSIDEILQKSISSFGQACSLSQRFSILAYIFHEMDLGIIGMNPIYIPESAQVYTATRAGEQALFLEPMRYQNFIPVLLEILRRCDRYHLNLYKELQYFMTLIENGSSELTNCLYDFILKSEKMGGGLCNWDMIFLPPFNTKFFRTGAECSVSDEFKKNVSIQMDYLEKYSSI